MSSKGTARPRGGGIKLTLRGGVAIIGFPRKIFQKAQADEFSAQMSRLSKRGVKQYVLDLGGCDYVSSEGLAATAHFWKWCHDESNGTMTVVLSPATNSEVANLFEIIGLSRIIGSAIQPSVDDAMAYLRKFS